MATQVCYTVYAELKLRSGATRRTYLVTVETFSEAVNYIADAADPSIEQPIEIQNLPVGAELVIDETTIEYLQVA